MINKENLFKHSSARINRQSAQMYYQQSPKNDILNQLYDKNQLKLSTFFATKAGFGLSPANNQHTKTPSQIEVKFPKKQTRHNYVKTASSDTLLLHDGKMQSYESKKPKKKIELTQLIESTSIYMTEPSQKSSDSILNKFQERFKQNDQLCAKCLCESEKDKEIFKLKKDIELLRVEKQILLNKEKESMNAFNKEIEKCRQEAKEKISKLIVQMDQINFDQEQISQVKEKMQELESKIYMIKDENHSLKEQLSHNKQITLKFMQQKQESWQKNQQLVMSLDCLVKQVKLMGKIMECLYIKQQPPLDILIQRNEKHQKQKISALQILNEDEEQLRQVIEKMREMDVEQHFYFAHLINQMQEILEESLQRFKNHFISDVSQTLMSANFQY